MVKERYSTWDSGIGAEIEQGKHDFKSLYNYMIEKGEVDLPQSGRQELIENIFNRFMF